MTQYLYARATDDLRLVEQMPPEPNTVHLTTQGGMSGYTGQHAKDFIAYRDQYAAKCPKVENHVEGWTPLQGKCYDPEKEGIEVKKEISLDGINWDYFELGKYYDPAGFQTRLVAIKKEPEVDDLDVHVPLPIKKTFKVVGGTIQGQDAEGNHSGEETQTNYLAVIPDSQFFPYLDMLIHFVKGSPEIDRNYLLKGLENSKERGYELSQQSVVSDGEESESQFSLLRTIYLDIEENVIHKVKTKHEAINELRSKYTITKK